MCVICTGNRNKKMFVVSCAVVDVGLFGTITGDVVDFMYCIGGLHTRWIF